MTPRNELKLFEQITALIGNMPELTRPIGSNNSQKWLAEAHAVVSASGDSKDADDFKRCVNQLILYEDHRDQSGESSMLKKPARRIEAIVLRTSEALKLKISGTD